MEQNFGHVGSMLILGDAFRDHAILLMLLELMGMWFISVQLVARVQIQGAPNRHFKSVC